MQQEEGWDREGLLDPAWEKQQRKVITPISVYVIFFYGLFISLLYIFYVAIKPSGL